jgi:hypothetical protein
MDYDLFAYFLFLKSVTFYGVVQLGLDRLNLGGFVEHWIALKIAEASVLQPVSVLTLN